MSVNVWEIRGPAAGVLQGTVVPFLCDAGFWPLNGPGPLLPEMWFYNEPNVFCW